MQLTHQELRECLAEIKHSDIPIPTQEKIIDALLGKYKIDLPPKRTFPIMREKEGIPWEILQKHESQAIKNHYQTLEQLADRGGISWYEAQCILSDCGFTMAYISDEYSKQRVLEMIREDGGA